MKNVTVLYFAGVRELTGIADEQLRVTDGVGSVQGLLAYLVRQRPELRGRLAGVRVARNETFVDESEPVADGDVLALIPPVQGG